jgi:hypothetical protein
VAVGCGGGGKVFFGGYDWLTILIPMVPIIFGELFTSNIMLFIPEEYPDPQPLTPLDPNRGGGLVEGRRASMRGGI